jgi:phenylalanyl-tRNA synthetase beta chain
MNNGVRPINSTIDKLAYVTLLTNIPTAIYDADKIDHNLSIAFANNEISIKAFGNKQYKLNHSDLVVKSGNNIISVAGVIGVNEFGLNDSTKDIVVEMANFNFVNIRNTTIRLDIKTDAAKRFSKPICNYEILLAQQLVFDQFVNQNKSTPINKLIEQKQNTFPVDFKFISTFLGVNIDQNTIMENLKFYGFTFDNNNVVIPLNRLDIENTNDIAEEVCKFLNINEIKDERISAQVGQVANNIKYELSKELKELLRNNHFSEVKTYNLTEEQSLQPFNVFKYTKFIKIENANNVSHEYLRSNLIHALLKTYEFNYSYKTPLQPIFEIQDIYANESNTNVTLLSESNVYLDRINKSQLIFNINGLRAVANLIANLFNTQFEYFNINDNNIFYDNESLAIHCNGKVIGYIGAIKKSKLKPYGLANTHIYCLTVNLNMLFDLYVKPTIQFKPVNNLMPIYKDISFIVKPGITINNVLNSFKQLTFINSYDFIDRYRMDDNKISYTIRFTFHNSQGLLTQTIDKYLEQIEKQLLENNCQVRK